MTVWCVVDRLVVMFVCCCVVMLYCLLCTHSSPFISHFSKVRPFI
jgi:hypothetical protein